ncbi:hypothetical protein [Soonwooa sp.]|uniref:hypothetical protein n=1 Tax=Soonwooa sp. TaxID=1938592 RepID=UPI0026140C15|nr:hypothetical protein [Soonwooa sp.]
MAILIFQDCSDRSEIEGLVFSDKAEVVMLGEELTNFNYSTQSYIGTITINNVVYNYNILYSRNVDNAGNITQCTIFLSSIQPLGFCTSNGGALYNFPENSEIGTNTGYYPGNFPLFTYYNNSNTASNTVKFDIPCYLGFNIGGNSEFATYGWLKLLIEKNKITIVSYGYKTGHTIKAGEN